MPPGAHFLDTQPLASPTVVAAAGSWSCRSPGTRSSTATTGRTTAATTCVTSASGSSAPCASSGRAGLAVGLAGTAALLAVVAAAGRRLRTAVRAADEPPAPSGPSGPAPPEPAGRGGSGAENLEAMEPGRQLPPVPGGHRAAGSRPEPAGPRLRRRHRPARPRAARPRARRQLRGAAPGAAGAAAPGRLLRRRPPRPESEPPTFGTVYSLNVLEHIEDDAAALRDLNAKLAPGRPARALRPGLRRAVLRHGPARRAPPALPDGTPGAAGPLGRLPGGPRASTWTASASWRRCCTGW